MRKPQVTQFKNKKNLTDTILIYDIITTADCTILWHTGNWIKFHNAKGLTIYQDPTCCRTITTFFSILVHLLE